MTTPTAPYYAQAFTLMPGRCFRLIGRGGQGPTHGRTTVRAATDSTGSP
jgi:hypothetical protein